MKRMPLTYVSSMTYDLIHKIMYPDALPVNRSLEEIERLLNSGHTIEWRNGTNRTVLTNSNFETLVKPLYKMYEIQDNKEAAMNRANTDTVIESIVSGEPTVVSVVPTGENTLINSIGSTPEPPTALFTAQNDLQFVVAPSTNKEDVAAEIKEDVIEEVVPQKDSDASASTTDATAEVSDNVSTDETTPIKENVTTTTSKKRK